MKKVILILILAILTWPVLILAEGTADKQFPAFTYLFHLYYDNGELFADRDHEFNYDLVAEVFVPERFTTQFPFSGEVVNLKGETVVTFKFDPRGGNPSFFKGKISVKAPYVADGQKVVFYDFQNNSLVTVFVSESSFCNDDGVCNFDKGEDEKTCTNDCTGVLPVTPPPPPEEGPADTNIAIRIVLILVLVGAGLGGWYGWRWWKSKNQTPQTIDFTS